MQEEYGLFTIWFEMNTMDYTTKVYVESEYEGYFYKMEQYEYETCDEYEIILDMLLEDASRLFSQVDLLKTYKEVGLKVVDEIPQRVINQEEVSKRGGGRSFRNRLNVYV